MPFFVVLACTRLQWLTAEPAPTPPFAVYCTSLSPTLMTTFDELPSWRSASSCSRRRNNVQVSSRFSQSRTIRTSGVICSKHNFCALNHRKLRKRIKEIIHPFGPNSIARQIKPINLSFDQQVWRSNGSRHRLRRYWL